MAARPELDEFVELVLGLRYRTTREIEGNPNFVVWSFAAISDLRAQDSTGRGERG